MDKEKRLKLLAEIRTGLYPALDADLVLVADSNGIETEGKGRHDLICDLEAVMEKSGRNGDGGEAVLTGQKESRQDTIGRVKVEPVMATSGASPAPGKSVSSSCWRKDLKLAGLIGDTAGDKTISYMNFLHQVQAAKDKGYSEIEIVNAIIWAIQPGARLRGYLEGRTDLTLGVVQKAIRTDYQEKSSTELYQELCNSTQGQSESAQNFLYRALEIRQKIMFASKESKFSYNPTLVEEQFKHAVKTGLRDYLLRGEMQTLLKTYDDDEELVAGLSQITKELEERKAKIGGATPKAKVSTVQEETNSSVLAEIQALRLEVKELRQSVGTSKERETSNDQGKPRDPHNSVKRRRNRCKACVLDNNVQRCFHCYLCGSGEHYRAFCPTCPTKPQQGNE
jgi:hypothetical protein